MIAIFVPRDKDELEKYKTADGFGKFIIKDKTLTVGDLRSVKLNDSNGTDIANVFHDSKKREVEKFEIKYHLYKGEEGTEKTWVVLIEEMPNKETMVNAFDYKLIQFIQDEAKLYLEIFLGVARNVAGANVAAKDVVVFIHWGGGQPIKMEEGFRRNCQQCNCSGLRLFSVSTRRSDKFNVKGKKIEIPKTSKDVDILVNKFMLDRVKDYLTEFVVSKTMSFKFPEDMSLVKAFLSWVKEQYWTSMVFEKEERKVWWDVFGKVIDNPCPVVGETDFLDKVVHVYSRIIEEGLQNG